MVFFGMPCTLRKLKLFVIGIPGSPHILNRTQCFKNRGHEVIIFSRIDSTELARTVFKRFPIAKLFQNYLSAIKLFFEFIDRYFKSVYPYAFPCIGHGVFHELIVFRT